MSVQLRIQCEPTSSPLPTKNIQTHFHIFLVYLRPKIFFLFKKKHFIITFCNLHEKASMISIKVPKKSESDCV